MKWFCRLGLHKWCLKRKLVVGLDVYECVRCELVKVQ